MTKTRSIAAACVLAFVTAPAWAATSWSTPAGTSDTITYSAGQTDNGLFTDSSPTVASDTLQFFPNNFTATSGAEQSSDTASVLVTAKTGRTLTSVTANLTGDYSILGDGVVNAMGTLTLTNPLTLAMITRTFDFTGQFIDPSGDGAFGDTVIALPVGWKSARVSLAAGLTATAEDGSTSFVQLKGASIGVETHVAAVPLPPAMLAAIPTVAMAYVARRRMSKA